MEGEFDTDGWLEGSKSFAKIGLVVGRFVEGASVGLAAAIFTPSKYALALLETQLKSRRGTEQRR